MTAPRPEPLPSETSHLQPDGTVFPPVTPDPPEPPGYVSPLEGHADLDISVSAGTAQEGRLSDEASVEAPD